MGGSPGLPMAIWGRKKVGKKKKKRDEIAKTEVLLERGIHFGPKNNEKPKKT